MKNIMLTGTCIEVTDETYVKIKALLTLDKPKFEPITICHVKISIYDKDNSGRRIMIRDACKSEEDYVCIQTLEEAKGTAEAILKAVAFLEEE